MDISTREITSRKVRGNHLDVWNIQITLKKKYVETTWIFRSEKLHRKKYVDTKQIFLTIEIHQKSSWKLHGFFNQWNYTEKSTWKQRRLFDHRNYIKKSTWKQPRFFDHRNYIEKKCVETMQIIRPAKLRLKSTWKWRGNSSKFDSTWSAHWEVSSVMQYKMVLLKRLYVKNWLKKCMLFRLLFIPW